MAKKRQFGRGINALLKDINTEIETSTTQEVVTELAKNFATLPISQVAPNPGQPRKDFDTVALEELATSIKTLGIIQPITVRLVKENEYQIISGERRYRASKLAGLQEIPAYIRIGNDQELLEMALVENIQRQDLNPIEVAASYERLIRECNLTHKQLSGRLGKSRSVITNFMRLLKLSPEAQKNVRDGLISMGHARSLVGVPDGDLQVKVLKDIIEYGHSVRQVEAIASALKSLPEDILSNVKKNVISISQARLIGDIKDAELQNILHLEIIENKLSEKESIVLSDVIKTLLPNAQESLKRGAITIGHAKILSSLDVVSQTDLHNQIIEKDLSVEATEKLAKSYGVQSRSVASKSAAKKPTSLPLEYRNIQDRLSHRFGKKIQLKVDPKGKGQIVLKFGDTNELNDLLDRLQYEE